MTMQLNSHRQPFAFNPSFDIDEAMGIVNGALARQHVSDTTADELKDRRINVRALGQRLSQSDEFDVAAFVTLVNTRFGVNRLNEALVGEVPTADIDTGIYRLAEMRAERAAA